MSNTKSIPGKLGKVSLHPIKLRMASFWIVSPPFNWMRILSFLIRYRSVYLVYSPLALDARSPFYAVKRFEPCQNHSDPVSDFLNSCNVRWTRDTVRRTFVCEKGNNSSKIVLLVSYAFCICRGGSKIWRKRSVSFKQGPGPHWGPQWVPDKALGAGGGRSPLKFLDSTDFVG